MNWPPARAVFGVVPDRWLRCFWRLCRCWWLCPDRWKYAADRWKLVICQMKSPEFWLRGPVSGVPLLLQPVAHALMQAREEINSMMEGFPDELLWERIAGLASPGFHLQHIAGVLDRLFTYAAGSRLTGGQLNDLGAEGKPRVGEETVKGLLDRLNTQIGSTLEELHRVGTQELTAARMVGRERLPSTVAGLMFHAAEHTMRHTGQLLVTVRVLRGGGIGDIGDGQAAGNRLE
jgi:uncharacterized damage-inducible protein DinB